MFKAYGVDFTQDDYIHYQKTNKQLWVDYQNGKITADYLQITRFTEWANKLNVSAKELNDAFLDAMANICEPLPGAVELLDKLKPHAKLGIITNGFALPTSSDITNHSNISFNPVCAKRALCSRAKPFVIIPNLA